MNLIKTFTSKTVIKSPKSDKILRYINMACENNWRGVPLTDIYGSQTPWGAPEFPLIVPSFNHTVLYHIPSNGSIAMDRPPKPQIGHDKWDHDFVRMPCSSQSLYPVEDNNGEVNLKKRWEIIESTLWKPIRNSQELADAILSYNTKFKNIWKFKTLHKLFNEYIEEDEAQYFFDVTLPEIAKLALALPKLIQSPIPLLKQNKNHSVSLSQQQISSLLANAFFCTFPRRNTRKKTSEYASYPHINFNTLYESCDTSSMEKLKCICHYFRRVCTKAPAGVVSYCRRAVPRPSPDWPRAPRPLATLPLHVDSDNTIEDSHGLIQVDFANKYLGGGVLGYGCVQEEIRFVICPELMISMLFTEMLLPNEALMMIGCERYSEYQGYGSSFHWSGDHRDQTPRDSSGRRRCAVLAIDALPYSSILHEYRRGSITRELNKAWIGFSFYTDEQSDGLQYPGVATGNWGCGAFGGSPQLKSLVQMMACAQAGRPMAYYTFNDMELRDEIINMYNVLAKNNVTVGQLYKYLIKFTRTNVLKTELHAFLFQTLKDEENAKSPKNNCESSQQLKNVSTSGHADPCDVELSDSLQEEFINNSPELFTQEEFDESKNETGTSKQTETVTKKETCVANESRKSDDKMAASGHKMASSHTSRLFEEMQKFDEDNGRLNFSETHTSPFTQTKRADVSMDDEDKIKLDISSEVKKKITRKITDYFSKKSI